MKRIAALVLALTAAPMAQADDSPGGYMGVSVGHAYFKHSCDGAPAGINCDNSDTAARVFAGYQFKPRFAMEVGFHGLGTIAAQGNGPATVTQTADISAIDFVYVGSWALGNRYALITKLGFYFGKIAVDATPSTGASRGWESRNTNDITYGLGASYALTDRADFRFEWQHFGHFGTGTAPELDIHLFSLGALYRF
jgi:OOP family OmpA-OmpF porin